MKTKKITLTIAERLEATKILNDFRGNLDKLAIILEDIKLFPLSEEEIKQIGGKTNVMPDGRETVTWNILLGETLMKEIEIQEDTLDYLRNSIKNKSDKGELGIDDSAVITLKDKLA